MRVIVIGAGEVGVNLAAILAEERHEVTLVDTDGERIDALRGEIDARLEEGNGASAEFLEKLEIGDVDLLAAVTQIDEVNLIAAMGAKQENPKMTVVARVRDPDLKPDGEGEGDEEITRGPFGVDYIIDPDYATASDIKAAMELPGAVSVEYFGDGRLGLVEIVLSEDSPLIGAPLAERERREANYIVGWSRDGDARLTHEEDVLEAGDHLIVVAARADLGSTAAKMAGRAREVKSCVLFGGGRISTRLATLLEKTPIRVTVLERDEDRARRLAEKVPKARVLHEEGVDRAELTRIGVGDADAFVASAGDDRANLLAALNAKRLGADLCLSVVSRQEFVPLVDALNIDGAFSPRLITAEAILRLVHGQAVRGMHLLRSGFEALELEIAPGAQIAGLELGGTRGLLSGVRVGAILRDGEVVIPGVGTELRPGDRVLMLAVEHTLAAVEKAFEPRS